jgi:hypothetical protein
MRRSLSITAACLIGVAAIGTAQTETPQQVAAHLWAAVQANDWDRAAGFMHPVALRELRALLEPLIMMKGVAGDSARQTIFGSVSRDSAAAATDSAVYANLMRFGASVKADLPGAIDGTDYKPLGTVPEGRDTIHVIGRVSVTMSGRPTSWIQVTSLMRLGPRWRGLLEPNWSQMAWALRAVATRSQ